MSQNRTFVWKEMNIWISWEHIFFNFERLDILCPRVVHSSETLWPFKYLESFCCSISSFSIYYVPELYIRVKSYHQLNFSTGSVVQFRESQYIMRLNFSRAYIFQFRASRYIVSPSRTFEWKVMTIWISREVLLINFERLDILCSLIGHPCEKLWPLELLEGIRCSISSVSIYYVPESYIRLISYDHLNFSKASVV